MNDEFLVFFITVVDFYSSLEKIHLINFFYKDSFSMFKMSVKSEGYTIKHYFLQSSSQCTHVLAETFEGHLIIVEVTPFHHDVGILTSKLTASLAPQTLINACIKNKLIRTKVCFLTHTGLDLYHMFGYSLLFKDPRADTPRLQLGEKFAMPLVYMKVDEIKIREGAPRLKYHVETDERLSVFNSLIKKSNCQHLLDASGPYMLFAPDNKMLEKAYGPNGNALRAKTQSLDIVVCSYFAPGKYDAAFDGTITVPTILGDELEIRSGVPHIPKHKTEIVEPMIYTSNGSLTIITSTGVMTSKNTSDFSIPKHLDTNMSIADIADNVLLLTRICIDRASQIRKDLREQLTLMNEKLDELDKDDAVISNIVNELRHLNASRSNAKTSDFKVANNIYFQYVKSASKTTALEPNIEAMVKNIKDI
jgi:uncharacterized surface protein with fasciclin (FAS1) repeats